MFSLPFFALPSVIPSPVSDWLSSLSCSLPRGAWAVALFFFLCYCYHLGGRTGSFGGMRRARGESVDRVGGMDGVRMGDGRRMMMPGSGQAGSRGVGLVGGSAGEEEEGGGGRVEDEANLRRRLYRSLQVRQIGIYIVLFI